MKTLRAVWFAKGPVSRVCVALLCRALDSRHFEEIEQVRTRTGNLGVGLVIENRLFDLSLFQKKLEPMINVPVRQLIS